MSRALAAFPTMLRIAFAELVAYRAEMVIWILTTTMPLVSLALWDAAAGDGQIEGYSSLDFTRYFLLTLIVRQLTSTWVAWELNYEVRTGGLSPKLLRPMNPLVFYWAQTLGALPFRMVVLSPLIAMVLLWRPEAAFLPDPWTFAALTLSCLLGLGLTFLIQAMFGCLAFWFEQSIGFFSVYYVVWSLFAGYLVPPALFPPALKAASTFLPFYASLGAPVEIGLGTAPILPTLGLQLAWVGILGGLAALTWARGIRRYGAVGA